MSARFRLEDLPKTVQDLNSWNHAFSAKAPSHKFKSQPQFADGMRFDSKLEFRHYEQLKLLKTAGTIKTFLRQVVFHLPGRTRHVVDWMLILPNREPVFCESKGSDLPMGRLKRRQVLELYGVKIHMWGQEQIDLSGIL